MYAIPVKVTWNCGMSIGPAYWKRYGDWVFEADECPGDGEFEIDPEEWEEMVFPMTCGSCGQEMDPVCDHFTADTGETSQELYIRVVEAP